MTAFITKAVDLTSFEFQKSVDSVLIAAANIAS